MPLDVPALWLPRGAVLSHTSAARAWDLPLPTRPDDKIHVIVPRHCGHFGATDAVVHRADAPPSDVAVMDGWPVTTVLRTLVDVARLWRRADAVAAADAALRRGLVTTDELAVRCGRAMGRGAARVRSLPALTDGLAESMLESHLRCVLTAAGLRPPASQFTVLDNGLFIARVDFAWPGLRLALEADGFAFHSGRAAYRSDREKANALERAGWSLLRFAYEHVMGAPDEVVAIVAATIARLQAA
jgi:hypothetical protein